jgi:undecaprenyl diphosphate synthase
MGGILEARSCRSVIEVPHHVAIIMDGNGRWATARGLPRVEGHRRGAKAVRRVVTAARERGITHLTLFAMSTENLGRPTDEVSKLFLLLRRFMLQEAELMRDKGIRFALMGDWSRLPPEVQDVARAVQSSTAAGRDMTLTVAVAYGGREDLVTGLQALVDEGGKVTPERLEGHLWSAHLPPVDLLIRSGGERRISNFLLWHLAYAELHFTDVYWPDFGVKDLERAISDYASRQRRYGQVPGRGPAASS